MDNASVKDIAKALNLSVGTVYRALNNTGRISEKTKKQVLEYASSVGYQPNSIAQGLAKRKKYHIVYLSVSGPSNWWKLIEKGAKKAAQELSEFGVEVTFLQYLPKRLSSEPLGLLDIIENQSVDGIILVPSIHREIMAALELAKEKNIPVVCINADSQLISQRLFYYGPDEEAVGQIAGELIGKMINGRGNVAIVGIESDDFYRLSLRKKGFFNQICRFFPDINVLAQNTFPLHDFKKYLSNMLSSFGEALSAIYVENSVILSDTANLVKELGLANIVIVGHECLDDCEELLREGWISATICQETFSQGYYPMKLLYHYLLTRNTIETNYHSNVHIVFRSNLSFLQKNENGCGFQ